MARGVRAAVLLLLVCLTASASARKHHDEQHKEMPIAEDQVPLLWEQTEVSTTPVSLPSLTKTANVTCKVRCNDEEDTAALTLPGQLEEAKSCVGTFTVVCKGHKGTGHGVYAAKCEGKTTTVEKDGAVVSVCEGLFKNFGKVATAINNTDKEFTAVAAYGCLGTTVAIKTIEGNSSSEDAPPALMAGLSDMEHADEVTGSIDSLWSAIGNDTIAEARCKGLSGRFRAFSVKDHHHHGPHHKGDKPKKGEHQDNEDSDEDKPKRGKHQDIEDSDEEKPKKMKGKHDKGKKGKHAHKEGEEKDAPKDCFNYDKLEHKLEDALHRAGMELVPKSLPSGTDLLEMGPGPQRGYRETCNGRPVWARGFLPCWGKFEVHAEMHGFEVSASCQGFWTGKLFKTCTGFSSFHGEYEHGEDGMEVYNFCAGKKAVRAGGKPGEGVAMGAWCKGKDLYVTKKLEESN